MATEIEHVTVSVLPIISRSMDDFLTPGVVVELTPDEAEALGAFEETALDEEAAWGSNIDVSADAAPVTQKLLKAEAGPVAGPLIPTTYQ